MPAAVAIPLIAAGASAGASIYAANRGSSAASRAAREQTQGANYAADIQARTNREAIEFQKQQAAEEARRYETDRQANYDQWAAREGRLGTLSQMWGFGNRPIPAYVPSRAGASSGTQATAPPAAGTPQAFIAEWQQTHAPSEGIAPLAAALKAKGFDVGRYMYGTTPSNNELNLGGEKWKVIGAEDSPTTAYWYQPGMDDSAPGTIGQMARRPAPPMTAYTPTAYVAPSTIRALARRR